MRVRCIKTSLFEGGSLETFCIRSTSRPDDFRHLKVEKTYPKVEFTLEAFPVDDAPHYEALSYAWDTLPASEECVCNGDEFHVSPTLFG